VSFAGAPLHGRLADQSAELLSALPKVLIDHLAYIRRAHAEKGNPARARTAIRDLPA
jgi:hypothetical protein